LPAGGIKPMPATIMAAEWNRAYTCCPSLGDKESVDLQARSLHQIKLEDVTAPFW
jgi:hypothetical protein